MFANFRYHISAPKTLAVFIFLFCALLLVFLSPTIFAAKINKNNIQEIMMPQNIINKEENIYSFLSRENYRHKEKSIAKWWNGFITANNLIKDYFSSNHKSKLDLPRWMHENLQAIDKNLMWEFYSGIKKKHRLVITSEGQRDLELLIRKILADAPELEEWEFYGYRLSENINNVSNIIKETKGWDEITDINTIKFEISRNNLNRLDIVYYLPSIKNTENISAYMFLLTTLVLGEEVVDKWIGYIDIKIADKKSSANKDHANISTLNLKVNEELKNIKNNLPTIPYFLTSFNSWTVAKFNPKKQNEYLHREDIESYALFSKEMLEPLLERNFFDSERFSRQNEIFVYLKFNKKAGNTTSQDLKSLSDTLDNHLRKINLGCVVGIATGLKYLYIDLALINKVTSIQEIQKIICSYNINNNFKLLFHDAVLTNISIDICKPKPRD